jgi:hypothetical protein
MESGAITGNQTSSKLENTSKGVIMNPFWRSSLIGTVLYTLLFFLPGINGVFGWAVLFLGGFLYMRWVHSAGSLQGSPVPYGMGMGFVVGALIRTVGSILKIVIAGIMVGSGWSSDPNATQAVGAFGAVGSFIGLLSAPVIGGFLGGMGGLIAGAMMPQGTKTV